MPATITSSSPTTGALALTATRDKTATWTIAVTQGDGVTPQDLTGATLLFYAAVGIVSITKTSAAGGITVTSVTGGIATLQIDPADTAALPNFGVIQGPCELTIEMASPAGFFEATKGTLTVEPNVGTP